jgi:hypothetical protein
MKGAVRVIQPDLPAEVVPAEIIATSIVEIARGMRAIEDSRLKRDAIVTLLQHSTKLARRDIIKVLDHLGDLEKTWLKPRKNRPIRP